jgi:hypothetical protein
MSQARSHRLPRLGLIPALASLSLLSACGDNLLTADLATTAPAKVSEIWVPLEGIQLEDEDGNITTLSTDSELVNLTAFDSGALHALISAENIDSATYVGVRLRFGDDSDAYVVDEDGDEHDLTIDTTDMPYADIDMAVDGNDSSTILDNSDEDFALVLTLDLRLSLADTDDGYVLTPVLRAVQSEDASTVEGSVSESLLSKSSCQQDRDLAEGVAVYLFESHDTTPDDYDGVDADPIATAPVTGSSGSYRYSLDDLAAGDYTVALTCDGDEEDGQSNDDLSFRDDQNVTLDNSDSETIDFD